jgi:hypothetical protein
MWPLKLAPQVRGAQKMSTLKVSGAKGPAAMTALMIQLQPVFEWGRFRFINHPVQPEPSPAITGMRIELGSQHC